MLACYKANVIECTSNEKLSSLDLAKASPSYAEKVAYHAPWVPYTIDALDKSLTKLTPIRTLKTASYGFRDRLDVERHLVNLIVQ